MKKFEYSGKDKNGNLQKGIVEATDRESVATVLQKRGISPLVINEKGKDLISFAKSIISYDHLSLSDKLMFCEEISALINAGVPLSKSIEIIKEQSGGTMRRVMDDLVKDIEGGASLSEALERQSNYFSPVFVNMIKAGEASGTLDKALEDLADQTRKDHELVSKIKGAMTYPVVILVAMIAAVFFLMTRVIPSIAGLFEELDTELPIVTKVLIDFSGIAVDYGIYIVIAILVFCISVYKIITGNPSLRKKIHLIVLKMPVIGKVAVKFNVARSSRTLGSLLASGVSVLESLQIVSNSTKNIIIQEEIDKIRNEVKNGSTLAKPMKKSQYFPTMVGQMVGVGEQTGNMDKMLLKAAKYYEKQIDSFTKNISSIIEPVVMLLVGVAIGFIVISIIMPIYQATQYIN